MHDLSSETLLTATTQDALAHQHLRQRVAVAIQRGNAVVIRETVACGSANLL